LEKKPDVFKGHGGHIRAVAIIPNESFSNKWLVTCSEDTTARLWDLQAQDPTTAYIILTDPTGHKQAIKTLAISSNNKWLVTGSEDGTACLWDLEAKDPTTNFSILRSHQGAIRALAISPDNKRLITGSDDRTVRLWDLQDPDAEPIILYGHKGPITSLAIGWSDERKWLVTGSEDGDIRIWNLQLEELIKFAKGVVGRNMTWEEWRRYFPREPYRKTVDNLPVPRSIIDTMLMQAQRFAIQGNTQEARLVYEKVVPWAIETYDADLNKDICEKGRKNGCSEEVKPACDLASKLKELTSVVCDPSIYKG